MLLVRRRAPEGSCFATATGRRRVRGAGHRVLGAARLHHLPGLPGLRRHPGRRRDRGRRSWPRWSRRPSSCRPAPRRSSPASWSATGAPSSAPSGTPWPPASGRTRSTRGAPRCSARSPPGAEDRHRAVGLRPVDGPDLATASRRATTASTPQRASSRPRCGWRFLICARHLRLHAVLRRQRRGGRHPGGADGQRRRGHHPADVAAASSTTRTARGSDGCSRPPWSGRCASSTPSSTPSASRSTRRATSRATPADQRALRRRSARGGRGRPGEQDDQAQHQHPERGRSAGSTGAHPRRRAARAPPRNPRNATHRGIALVRRPTVLTESVNTAAIRMA